MYLLKKFDLIDLYYPTKATVELLLRVPPEQREALLRRMLAGVSEAEAEPHIARVLARIEESAGGGRP
jgi:hypothetical protein